MIELSVVNDTNAGLNPISPTKIKIIGCGGGGSSAVNRLIKDGVENVDFIVVNTDVQALNASPANQKIAIGQKLTGGLGAGGNPQVGEDAAKEDIETLKNVITGSDMVIITAGMGGGTGTGSAPIIAGLAKEAGALTVAVVTTPFGFEGPVRMRYATNGINNLRKSVDSLIIIPNEQVIKLAEKKLNMKEAYRLADDVLCQGVRGISEIITKTGEPNLDFNDVTTVMKNQGEAILGVGRGSGENKALEAAQQAINNPMLENRTIDGAKNILINICGGESLLMDETSEIVNTICETAARDHQVFWGQITDESMGDEVSVTVIATGFNQIDQSESSTEAENEDVFSRKDFENVFKPDISRDSIFGNTDAVSATSLDNPGGFSFMNNANLDVPHANAPVNENGKKEGISSFFDNNISSHGAAVPDDFVVNPNDIEQPAWYRQQAAKKGLSRSINLSE